MTASLSWILARRSSLTHQAHSLLTLPPPLRGWLPTWRVALRRWRLLLQSETLRHGRRKPQSLSLRIRHRLRQSNYAGAAPQSNNGLAKILWDDRHLLLSRP